VYCGLLILIINFGFPDWFPEGIERTRTSPYITLVILVPKGIELTVVFFFFQTKPGYYATKDGLIRSIKGDEVKKWYDFYGYSLQEEKSLLKFQMKNLRFFSIQYDQEYFHENKKEIVSFLDSKLTRI
jgi:hypothetical protein